MEKIQTFFVLRGRLNGQDGVFATSRKDGHYLRDGWYYLLANQDDPDHYPYAERGEAIAAARARLTEQQQQEACS